MYAVECAGCFYEYSVYRTTHKDQDLFILQIRNWDIES